MYELKLEDTADRHLGRILEMQAQHNGDTVYLITDSARITFARANEVSNRLAAGFAAMGVGKGDRVSFYMANVPELVLMCLALNKLGAIWVPVCTDYKGEWLADSLSRSRPCAIVSDAEHIDRLSEVRDAIDCKQLIVLEDELAASHSAVAYSQLVAHEEYVADYSQMDYGDTCAILWTSGTTGKSKGVMIAHNNWLRSILQGTNHQYFSRTGDIVYCAMPLYNAGAWITCVLRALIMGIGCVIEKKFSVSHFMDRIKAFGATQTFAVGSMGVFLMNAPARDDDADNPLREACIVPMPPAMWQAFETRFGVRLVASGLGQSECLLTLNHEHSDVEAPVYALGFEVPDAQVRLFDDDGNEVPDGEAGEICVRPLRPHVVFNGYFDNPEATAAAFRGEWFLTGDMARKDPETGAFFFVDRKKDAVRFAGRNISTLEVESVAMRHPQVAQAAAFGIPTAELASEDELKLNVVPASGAEPTPEDICRFINENAPYYFVPRYLEIVESLPYTPTNKVEKYKLRAQGVTESTWDRLAAGFELQR
ncbi:MAG: AMP-binding protein [Gammaproteobacteria bacterium]|nr:AMP-binding protein [Gammaproteobacteria bacterium]